MRRDADCSSDRLADGPTPSCTLGRRGASIVTPLSRVRSDGCHSESLTAVASVQLISNSRRQRAHSWVRTRLGSGARARQLGQTPYVPRRCGGALRFSAEPFTTLHCCGGRGWISSHARSTPTLRWLTSITAWRSVSSMTRYHAPRRIFMGTSACRRAKRIAITAPGAGDEWARHNIVLCASGGGAGGLKPCQVLSQPMSK